MFVVSSTIKWVCSCVWELAQTQRINLMMVKGILWMLHFKPFRLRVELMQIALKAITHKWATQHTHTQYHNINMYNSYLHLTAGWYSGAHAHNIHTYTRHLAWIQLTWYEEAKAAIIYSQTHTQRVVAVTTQVLATALDCHLYIYKAGSLYTHTSPTRLWWIWGSNSIDSKLYRTITSHLAWWLASAIAWQPIQHKYTYVRKRIKNAHCPVGSSMDETLQHIEVLGLSPT